MTPHRFTPIVHSQSAIEVSQAGAPPAPIPALLQITCAVPNASNVRRASSSTCSRRETSVRTAIASTPPRPISSRARARGAASTSARTIFIPSRANLSAIARPMPLAAPVTTATFPFRSRISPSKRCIGPSLHAPHVGTDRPARRRPLRRPRLRRDVPIVGRRRGTDCTTAEPVGVGGGPIYRAGEQRRKRGGRRRGRRDGGAGPIPFMQFQRGLRRRSARRVLSQRLERGHRLIAERCVRRVVRLPAGAPDLRDVHRPRYPSPRVRRGDAPLHARRLLSEHEHELRARLTFRHIFSTSAAAPTEEEQRRDAEDAEGAEGKGGEESQRSW